MSALLPNDNMPLNFPTDYNAIVDRIDAIDAVQYGRTRNFIDGDVTYLSPYISRGVISVKQVHDRVLMRHDPLTIGKFLQELAWREYFQRVWQTKGDALFNGLRQPQTEVLHHQMITSLHEATTGI